MAATSQLMTVQIEFDDGTVVRQRFSGEEVSDLTGAAMHGYGWFKYYVDDNAVLVNFAHVLSIRVMPNE